MRILLASAPVINREIDFNLQTLLEYMKAYRGKVELIVFGESILQGFECLCWDYEKDRSVGIALEDAPVRRIRAAAKEYRLAVSFGMIERRGDHLYSAQLTIGADGELVNLFHRVSVGWKDVSQTDEHYREGERFEKFTCNGKSFAVGLCHGRLRSFSERLHRAGASLRQTGNPADRTITTCLDQAAGGASQRPFSTSLIFD